MNDRHVGTCSLCGGRVMLPGIWHGVIPPEPTCERCHATAEKPQMPVIPMRPRTEPNTFRVMDGDVMILDDGRVIPLGRKL